jgi:electron transport complex protein RnfG
MQKNNFIRFAATLGIICLASSGLLSVVHNITKPKILLVQQKEEEEALKEAFPEGKKFEPVKKAEEILYYNVKNQKGVLLGYVFKASQRGYASDIVTMVGLNLDGKIANIKILSQNETPGLGTKIVEVISKETIWDVVLRKVHIEKKPQSWFQAQFRDKEVGTLNQEVDTITGATISSSAVIESIQRKANQLKEHLVNE